MNLKKEKTIPVNITGDVATMNVLFTKQQRVLG